jgi:hypothetical protein
VEPGLHPLAAEEALESTPQTNLFSMVLTAPVAAVRRVEQVAAVALTATLLGQLLGVSEVKAVTLLTTLEAGPAGKKVTFSPLQYLSGMPGRAAEAEDQADRVVEVDQAVLRARLVPVDLVDLVAQVELVVQL